MQKTWIVGKQTMSVGTWEPIVPWQLQLPFTLLIIMATHTFFTYFLHVLAQSFPAQAT